MIIMDENGVEIDVLAERNKEITEKLKPTLEVFLREKKSMIAFKKPMNLGYRFTKQIFSVLATYPKMEVNDFVRMDYDTLNDYWLKYLSLTAYYNLYFEIVDNKQLLMAFMGINSRQYKDLENHENEDIRDLMGMINNAFVGLGFIANESGNASSSATMGRLQAKGEGHGLVKESDSQLINAVSKRTPQDTLRELANIIGGDSKKIIKK